MIGCMAWLFDALVHVHLHQRPQAVLAFVLSGIFAAAWFFYNRQPGR